MPVVINRRPSVPSPLPPSPTPGSKKNENGAQTAPSSPLPLSPTPGSEKVKVERNHLHEIGTEPTRKRGRRGQHFDNAVERVAPYLAAARDAGQNSEQAMMSYLNAQAVAPPTGELWTAGTMHRVLVREKELKLGPGPRSSDDAAEARPSRTGQGERSAFR